MTENPISENGNWSNGKTDGVDWSNVETRGGGLAQGTDSGTIDFADSTAILKGKWGPTQTVEATVHSVLQNANVYEEVELRLRTSIAPHRIRGYEINFRCLKGNPASYTEIVRWNGPLGAFQYLSRQNGAAFGVADGDMVKATISKDTITVFVNGIQTSQVRDTNIKSGSPGIGFYFRGPLTTRNSGFKDFTAIGRD